MASSNRVTPKPVISPVNMGCSQETGIKDWAPRLYTSCGRAVCSAEINDFWSNRSPEINSILSLQMADPLEIDCATAAHQPKDLIALFPAAIQPSTNRLGQ